LQDVRASWRAANAKRIEEREHHEVTSERKKKNPQTQNPPPTTWSPPFHTTPGQKAKGGGGSDEGKETRITDVMNWDEPNIPGTESHERHTRRKIKQRETDCHQKQRTRTKRI